jgi:hypothetical protein
LHQGLRGCNRWLDLRLWVKVKACCPAIQMNRWDKRLSVLLAHLRCSEIEGVNAVGTVAKLTAQP